MKDILLAHAARYPKMEPRDAVKLIYQSTFGGGHLITDENTCLQRLQAEYAATAQNPEQPPLEDIGGCMVRVHLAALDHSGYTPKQLCQDFIRSAAMVRGSAETFRQRLTLLSELTAAGQLPFSMEALSGYLADYERAGFPPVSHSEAYRASYHPAYRVVDVRCLPKEYRML